ncbi:MAG: hypothetical protein WA949_16765 [Phormidesmis sp.]
MSSPFRSVPSENPSQKTLGQTLQASCKAIANFMKHRPQPSAKQSGVLPKHRYGAKAGLYPYLPTIEEERDWLEQVHDLE